MRTKSSRRRIGRLLAVLTVLVSLSGVASAQQSGLFPLHPIKRERVPCPMEDPIYKTYRSEYYGYYPTQWRPFPQGWNLPSPEGPNTKEALAKQPIEAAAPPAPMDEGPDEEAPAAERDQRPAPTPPAENERSPFEMDRPDNGAAPGVTPRPRVPNGTTPPAANERSPFEMPDDEPAAPRARGPQSSRPSSNLPDLDAPGAGTAPPRTSRLDRGGDRVANRDSGPMLDMPDASLPSIEEADSMSSVPTPHPSLPAASVPVADATAPPQMTAPPQRRGRVASFFAGLGLNRLRR